MTQLPASIQAYLEESGFTATEIAVLKKLIEGKPVTIRELAAKCGKSTGTLTQAINKLADKGIMAKTEVNDTTKYDIESIEAIREWIEKDTRHKFETMYRKKENFDAFISTIKYEKDHPEIHHFHDEEGMKKAYTKLLEIDDTEWLLLCPANAPEEENPLHEIEAELFRERKRRKIPMRVLSPDTKEGKIRKSKDPIEYKETRLMTTDDFPTTYAKFIVGDTIASFDLKENKASFIRFAEFADSQKNIFNMMWRIAGEMEEKQIASKKEVGGRGKKKEPSIESKVLTQLRTFFFGKHSLKALATLAVLSGVVTGGMYAYTSKLNTERIRERVTAIAANATAEFADLDLTTLRSEADTQSITYKETLQRLNTVRDRNSTIMYVYILRESSSEAEFEFVADADGIYFGQNHDTNHDGVYDEADTIGLPGMLYDTEVDVLMSREYTAKPIANKKVYTDKWGSFITGYAQIFNENGEPMGILAVDMTIDDLHDITAEAFEPFLYFVLVFIIFLLVRLFAFNKTLSKEIWELCRKKNVLITAAICAAVALLSTVLIYQYLQNLNTERVRDQVKAIVSTAVQEFDVADIDKLWTAADIEKPEWRKLVMQLQSIRDRNPDLRYAYIMRPTDDPNTYTFVADADSLDPYAEVDLNQDGKITEADALNPPGDPYDITEVESFKIGLKTPAADKEPYTDQWGTFISGVAPIKDSNGNTVAVLGVDRVADDIGELTLGTFHPVTTFVSLFVFFILFRLVVFHPELFKGLVQCSKQKRLFLIVGISGGIALFSTVFLYQYLQNLNTERIREKVYAVATTGAKLFDANDIVQLHTRSDMQKPAYVTVVKQLDDILKSNEGLKYVYIVRPTDTENMYEFVADSYGLDIDKGIDFNDDGILDEYDEIPIPGMPYDVSEIPGAVQGMIKPNVDKDPFTDQWGTFISGFAPIFDEHGKAIAVLGIDKIANDVKEITLGTFNPISYFLGIFAFLVLFRFVVFHQSLAKDILQLMKSKRFLISITVCSGVALIVTLGMYWYTLGLMKVEIGKRLMSIAATAAPEIDAQDLEPLRFARDMKRPEYQRVYEKLNEIRDQNEDIWFAYIMRPSVYYDEMYEFVADADSNFYLTENNTLDSIDVVPPGTMYSTYHFGETYINHVMEKPIAEDDMVTDKWGTYLSAAAPIYNSTGESVAFIGLDMDIKKVYVQTQARFQILIWFLVTLFILLLIKLFGIKLV